MVQLKLEQQQQQIMFPLWKEQQRVRAQVVQLNLLLSLFLKGVPMPSNGSKCHCFFQTVVNVVVKERTRVNSASSALASESQPVEEAFSFNSKSRGYGRHSSLTSIHPFIHSFQYHSTTTIDHSIKKLWCTACDLQCWAQIVHSGCFCTVECHCNSLLSLFDCTLYTLTYTQTHLRNWCLFVQPVSIY